MSIRLRLTLLYSLILALTLTAFSGVLYAIQSRYTLNIIKSDLSMDAMRMAQVLARVERGLGRGLLPLAPWRGEMMSGRVPVPQPLDIRALRTRDTVWLLDAEGNPLHKTNNEQGEDLSLSEEGLAQLQNGWPWTEIVPAEEGRLLIYNYPVVYGGTTIGIVQVARSLADRDRSLQALGGTLILGSLSTTLIAFAIGWGLAGVTLRPIHRITQTAGEIGRTRDFASRVSYHGPNDELGRLATTLNGMLSHLQDAYQRVAHSLEVQRDFVTDVSHELRTPLTTIRGNLALLQREPAVPAAERQDILDDLIGESERLIRLVSDLLTLARVDAGRKLARDRVEVSSLVGDVCRQARLLEPGREIELGGPEDAVALGDRDALKQVLLILIDNALKHAEGPVRVTLGESDRAVTVTVRDSGPGMSPDLRDRVFDRFYRGDASRSTTGFGLGLSIAKSLVEAQQGTIAVEGEEGSGSAFVVSLPQLPASLEQTTPIP